MSARSAAWYAENRERRQVTMRLYASAMTQLGQRYPAERLRAYRRALKAGVRRGVPAENRARAAVRDAHKDEFRLLLARLREQAAA